MAGFSLEQFSLDRLTKDPTQQKVAYAGLGLVSAAVVYKISGFLFRRLQDVKVIDRKDARDCYDKYAKTANSANDAESGYGGPCSTAIAVKGDFSNAKCVFEYGTGRGNLAKKLFKLAFGPQTKYYGIDQSGEMIARCKEALAQYGERAHVVHLPTGEPTEVPTKVPQMIGNCDRFLSSYVLDLLSDDDIAKVLALAWDTLLPGGKLVLAGITFGSWSMPITIYWTLRWEIKRLLDPPEMGGCRPQKISEYVMKANKETNANWQIELVEKIFPDGSPWMCSEVLVARKPL